jgi:beta-lactamase superfamily II metal-dependent hydrolase
MRIQVFQSDKGDCLLLTAADDTRVLVDGGMRSSYSQHVAPALGRIAREGGKLDLVYVSHIDQDHISGVLQLVEDEIAWRVRDFQHSTGNTGFKDPVRARPPQVKRIWHNAFSDVVRENAGPIEEAVAADAAVLEAGSAERALAQAERNLATSISEGIQLSRRVGSDQLGIPLNEEFGGKLAMVRPERQTLRLGRLRLTVIGPFQRDLEKLRKEWNEWLQTHKTALDRLRSRMRADAERLGAGELERFRNAIEQRAAELGERDRVTTPNLASLMLLAEEDGRTLLLTGDGHSEDILRGLEAAGRLEDGAGHFGVLKVQHHGSEHNIDADFCRKVTADHYVFCANGEHENPDLRVVETIVRSRVDPRRRGDHADAGRRFKLWFNSSSTASEDERGRAHMAKVEELVDRLARDSHEQLRFAFLDRSHFVVR